MTERVLDCVHCGTRLDERGALWFRDQPYCCDGCRTVAQIIHDGGLDAFYARRDGYSPRPVSRSCGAFDSEGYSAAYVETLPDGAAQTRLHIGGVRCAACTWLVERGVGRLPGVRDVHVSYGTGDATVTWDPAQVPLSQVAQRIADLGYQPLTLATRHRADPELLARLGVAVFCAMNVMLLAVTLYAGWFDGMAERHAALFRWLALAIATPAVLYSAVPFFSRAWAGLRQGLLHMDVPISLAVGVMYGHGLVATLGGHDAYLDSLTMLIALLLVGRLVDDRGRARVDAAAAALLAEAPASARREVDGGVEDVPVASLEPGDRVVVGIGEALTVDGRVAYGEARLDTALLTGESMPRAVAVGDAVATGSLVIEGHLVVVAEAVGEGTLRARMARMVAEARSDRGAAERLADRLAPWFTGAVLLVATLTFGAWAASAGVAAALPVTIAVLVVACPCALALATPAAVAAGVAAAARRGAFVRSGAVLDRLSRVDRIALDKTGTLTEGVLGVTEADDAVLRLATGLERFSHHPIARAVLAEAERRGLPLAAGEAVVERPGVGVEGVVDGRVLRLAGDGDDGVALWELGDQPEKLGRIGLCDRLRDDAAAVVASLDRPVHLLTGDAPETAKRIGQQAGLERVEAGLLPDDKAAWVREHRARGEVVLFAGDGFNDAPALASADVGVAMGSGASATVMTADVIVLASSLRPIAAALVAGRVTRRALLRNTVLSVSYNVVAVSAAVAGLVNPLVAALLMPLSSLMVVTSSLMIERGVRRGHRSGTAAGVAPPSGDVRLALRAGGAVGSV